MLYHDMWKEEKMIMSMICYSILLSSCTPCVSPLTFYNFLSYSLLPFFISFYRSNGVLPLISPLTAIDPQPY